MRISVWRSDVCSSDLFSVGTTQNRTGNNERVVGRGRALIRRCVLRESGSRNQRDAQDDGRDAQLQLRKMGFLHSAVPCYWWLNYLNGWRVQAESPPRQTRSEEHTSELQSLMRISYAVFCLKKKKTIHKQT